MEPAWERPGGYCALGLRPMKASRKKGLADLIQLQVDSCAGNMEDALN